jgi:hypothetical protein
MNNLNTQQITRCTMRIYDPEFSKKMSELYRKVGGNQNDFFLLLMKEGYKSVAPLYANISLPVGESVKDSKDQSIDRDLREIKTLLVERSDVETKQIANLADDHESIMKLCSCLYHLLLMSGMDDKNIKEIVENGGFDGIPMRFKKLRNIPR